MAKRPAQPRYLVDTQALRNLALTNPIGRLHKALSISKSCLYALLEGAQPRKRTVADKVNWNVELLLAAHDLVGVVSAGLNHNANQRISVRSDTRGPMTQHEVLRYPLGDIEQRYDAADNTLLVRRARIYEILRQSIWITNPDASTKELIDNGLLTPVSTQQNLAVGCSMPHRLVDTYRIDLADIRWSALRQSVEESAQRSDPATDGRVAPARQFSRLHY